MSGLYFLITVLILVFIAFAIWKSVQRRKELAAWAAEKGLLFSATKDRGFDDRFSSFGCLRKGHSRYAYNIAEGDWNGRRVMAFDYRYVTGSGKNRSTHYFSAIILCSDVQLKPLSIRPEGVFDRVTEFFGLDDIDFESAEFSRRFYVKSSDKRWAYDVIHPRTMKFLLSMPRFSIELDRTHVIVWKNRRFDPEAFETAIAIAAGLLDNLPTYLTAEQGSKGG
jgi:hypothetical protein